MSSHAALTHGGKIKVDKDEYLHIDQPLNNRKDKEKFIDTCDRYGLKSQPKVKRRRRRRRQRINPIDEVDEDDEVVDKDEEGNFVHDYLPPNVTPAEGERRRGRRSGSSLPGSVVGSEEIGSEQEEREEEEGDGNKSNAISASDPNNVTYTNSVGISTSLSNNSSILKKSTLSDAVKTINNHQQVQDKKSSRNRIVQRVYQRSKGDFDTRYKFISEESSHSIARISSSIIALKKLNKSKADPERLFIKRVPRDSLKEEEEEDEEEDVTVCNEELPLDEDLEEALGDRSRDEPLPAKRKRVEGPKEGSGLRQKQQDRQKQLQQVQERKQQQLKQKQEEEQRRQQQIRERKELEEQKREEQSREQEIQQLKRQQQQQQQQELKKQQQIQKQNEQEELRRQKQQLLEKRQQEQQQQQEQKRLVQLKQQELKKQQEQLRNQQKEVEKRNQGEKRSQVEQQKQQQELKELQEQQRLQKVQEEKKQREEERQQQKQQQEEKRQKQIQQQKQEKEERLKQQQQQQEEKQKQLLEKQKQGKERQQEQKLQEQKQKEERQRQEDLKKQQLEKEQHQQKQQLELKQQQEQQRLQKVQEEKKQREEEQVQQKQQENKRQNKIHQQKQEKEEQLKQQQEEKQKQLLEKQKQGKQSQQEQKLPQQKQKEERQKHEEQKKQQTQEEKRQREEKQQQEKQQQEEKRQQLLEQQQQQQEEKQKQLLAKQKQGKQRQQEQKLQEQKQKEERQKQEEQKKQQIQEEKQQREEKRQQLLQQQQQQQEEKQNQLLEKQKQGKQRQQEQKLQEHKQKEERQKEEEQKKQQIQEEKQQREEKRQQEKQQEKRQQLPQRQKKGKEQNQHELKLQEQKQKEEHQKREEQRQQQLQQKEEQERQKEQRQQQLAQLKAQKEEKLKQRDNEEKPRKQKPPKKRTATVPTEEIRAKFQALKKQEEDKKTGKEDESAPDHDDNLVEKEEKEADEFAESLDLPNSLDTEKTAGHLNPSPNQVLPNIESPPEVDLDDPARGEGEKENKSATIKIRVKSRGEITQEREETEEEEGRKEEEEGRKEEEEGIKEEEEERKEEAEGGKEEEDKKVKKPGKKEKKKKRKGKGKKPDDGEVKEAETDADNASEKAENAGKEDTSVTNEGFVRNPETGEYSPLQSSAKGARESEEGAEAEAEAETESEAKEGGAEISKKRKKVRDFLKNAEANRKREHSRRAEQLAFQVEEVKASFIEENPLKKIEKIEEKENQRSFNVEIRSPTEYSQSDGSPTNKLTVDMSAKSFIHSENFSSDSEGEGAAASSTPQSPKQLPPSPPPLPPRPTSSSKEPYSSDPSRASSAPDNPQIIVGGDSPSTASLVHVMDISKPGSQTSQEDAIAINLNHQPTVVSSAPASIKAMEQNMENAATTDAVAVSTAAVAAVASRNSSAKSQRRNKSAKSRPTSKLQMNPPESTSITIPPISDVDIDTEMRDDKENIEDATPAVAATSDTENVEKMPQEETAPAASSSDQSTVSIDATKMLLDQKLKLGRFPHQPRKVVSATKPRGRPITASTPSSGLWRSASGRKRPLTADSIPNNNSGPDFTSPTLSLLRNAVEQDMSHIRSGGGDATDDKKGPLANVERKAVPETAAVTTSTVEASKPSTESSTSGADISAVVVAMAPDGVVSSPQSSAETEKKEISAEKEEQEEQRSPFRRDTPQRQSRQSIASLCVSTKADLTPGERHLLGASRRTSSTNSAASGVSKETWEILLAQANQAHEDSDRNFAAVAAKHRISRASSAASTNSDSRGSPIDVADTKKLIKTGGAGGNQHCNHHHHCCQNVDYRTPKGEEEEEEEARKRRERRNKCCGIDKLRLIQIALFLLCFVIVLVIILIILLFVVYAEQEKNKSPDQDQVMVLLHELKAEVALLKISGGGNDTGLCGICSASNRTTMMMKEIQEEASSLEQILQNINNLTIVKEETEAFKDKAVEAWLFKNNDCGENGTQGNLTSSCVPQYMENFIVYVKAALKRVMDGCGTGSVSGISNTQSAVEALQSNFSDLKAEMSSNSDQLRVLDESLLGQTSLLVQHQNQTSAFLVEIRNAVSDVKNASTTEMEALIEMMKKQNETLRDLGDQMNASFVQIDDQIESLNSRYALLVNSYENVTETLRDHNQIILNLTAMEEENHEILLGIQQNQQNCSLNLIKSVANLEQIGRIYDNITDFSSLIEDKVLQPFPDNYYKVGVSWEITGCAPVQTTQKEIVTTGGLCQNTSTALEIIDESLDGNGTCAHPDTVATLRGEIGELNTYLERLVKYLNVNASCDDTTSEDADIGDQVNILAFFYTYSGNPRAISVVPMGVSTVDVITSVKAGGAFTNDTELLGQYELHARTLTADLNFALGDENVAIKKYVKIISTYEAAVIAMPQSSTDDAYLSLPTRTWGNQYIVPTFEPGGFFHSVIMIMASQPTFVEVKSTQCDPGNFNLDENEAIQVLCIGKDFTGAEVISTKPVGIIAGTTCVKSSASSPVCPQTASQVPPVQKWGSRFATSGTKSGDVIRVLAEQDATDVRVTGNAAATILTKGAYLDFDLNADEVKSIWCSRRCLVAQLLKKTGNYKEAMMILPAVTQYRQKEIAFPIPDFGATDTEHYLQLTTRTSVKSSLMLNGVSLGGEAWTAVPGMTEFSHLKKAVASGVHLLQSNSTVLYGATAYGYRTMTGDDVRSYAFPITFEL